MTEKDEEKKKETGYVVQRSLFPQWCPQNGACD